MWVKVCGLTSARDARLAAELGASACGFVFAESPRRVSVRDLFSLADGLPAAVARVGVFRDPAEADVRAALKTGLLDLLQFHGSESESFCSAFGKPYIKAMPLGAALGSPDSHAAALALLVEGSDSPGSGRPWDYGTARELASRRRLVLAGGLTVNNVARAISAAAPFGVDVSSGVESAPGVKDATLMEDFIRKTKGLDDDGA
ncbi:MAG: phosphoribosylanthranilate isomerase [Candidatus Geothermincolia bacterium]